MNKFKSEKELLRFISAHAPFAVRPQRDSKYAFVNPFRTLHGRDAVLKHLAEELWMKLEDDE